MRAMPDQSPIDPSLLEFFDSPTDAPFVIEHVSEEFTSVCPKTGHPDFAHVILRYEPKAVSMSPAWMQLITVWKGRGGIRSRVVATYGAVPECWKTKLDA
jgi:7-cyano-7-deazaguanine reductase